MDWSVEPQETAPEPILMIKPVSHSFALLSKAAQQNQKTALYTKEMERTYETTSLGDGRSGGWCSHMMVSKGVHAARWTLRMKDKETEIVVPAMN
jgi:hypothetical protein